MTDLLFDIARIAPLQPGCIEGDRIFLFPALDAAAERVRSALVDAHGVRPGDRIAILAGRGWRWIPLLFGIFRAEAVAVPLNLRLPPSALRERIRFVGARLLVLDETRAGMFPELPSTVLEGLCADTLHDGRAEAVDLDIDRPATLIFTSGSSGAPRAIAHSYANHYFSALGAHRHFHLIPGDRWLLSLPLYHVGGLGILFRCLLAGATVVIADEDRGMGEMVQDYDITHLSLVPTQLLRLLAQPGVRPRRLKRVVLGGAPVPEGLAARAAAAGYPVTTTYGMTETASMVTAGTEGDGACLGHRELRISDDGEILVRGPVVCLGEWREGSVSPLAGEAGWLATGDLGELCQGILRVKGRRDGMFISGGENIHPEEIERWLPEVTGASTVVVTPLDDPEFGQRPCAWVDLPEAEFRVAEWTARLRERLPGYMIPVQWRSLPAGAGLKPDRRALTSLSSSV